MANDKIYMDEAGYQSHLAEIERLRGKIAELSASRKANQAVVDRDTKNNTGTQDIDREEKVLLTILQGLINDLPRIEIIERQEKTLENSDIIDINDMVEVELSFSSGKKASQVVRLVGALSESIPGITNVSLNSPIGRAIYGKKVGETASYQVEENTINVLIKGHTREENQTRA